ncbi:MAG TPA: ketoacyl-ACP synthase III [Cyclobacteriaceae bacterium]|nr:ketoacyl-ACP synthase III [Cyclobacteriaceae bacterium]
MITAAITGTGCYIPETIVGNNSFLDAQFFGKDGIKLYQSNAAIIDKFKAVTGIEERRYSKPGQNASDLGYLAALEAIASAQIDKESLDYVIVAHNFGDTAFETNRVNQLPSLASRIKSLLAIQNPDCVAYDVAFGCPGWLEAVIQANYFIRSGDAKKCLVIGTEALSRVIDVHDRDSMIFSDGAGAVVLEATETGSSGILAHKTQTYGDYSSILSMGPSCFPYGKDKNELFLKMEGRKVYEFALTRVPGVIKSCLDKAGIDLGMVSKILVHQANEKMDKAILERVFKLYNCNEVMDHVMPMTISRLGNSSVATIPTMLDLLVRNKLDGHSVKPGDIIVMASVGAGMNINSLVYRV